MSNKLLFTLIALFVSLCTLFYVMFFYSIDNSVYTKPSLKKLVFNQPSDALLSISPSYLAATASANTSMDIILETKSSPNIVQLEIAYDPSSLFNVSIFPGDYYLTPEILLEKIDYKNGRISFALSGEEINTNSKIIARIFFTPLNYGVRKQTELKFLPKTSIKDGIRLMDLKSISGSTILINPTFAVPTATPSPQLIPAI